MRGKAWLVLAGWCCAVGCSSIQRVKVTPTESVVLTGGEIQSVRTKALALLVEQPRTLVRMTQVAQMFEQVARSAPEDYEARWQAAAAWTFVAENETNSPVRINAAKRGITLARQARELQPDRVEGHYFYAIAVGLLADADRTYGLKAVGEMEPALRRAIELDERYDYGGPVRVLGILLLRTPPPPVSIGSSRKGLRWMQHAVELFPDYPENLLYLAEGLHNNGKDGEACLLLQRVMTAPPWPDRQFESAGWKITAKKLFQCPPPM